MRRTRDEEHGFTIVELMVAVLLMAVVGGVVTTAVTSGLQAQRRQTEEVAALASAKTVLERVSRDLRAADPLQVADPDAVRVRVRRSGGEQVVRYTVEPSGAGTHRLVAQHDAQPPRTLLEGLAPPADGRVFTFLGDGGADLSVAGDVDEGLVRTVRIRLPLRLAQSQRTQVLTDQVTLRNAGSG